MGIEKERMKGCGIIQYGLQWQTNGYEERRISYANEPVLYYRFRSDSGGGAVHVVPDGCTDLMFCCEPSKAQAEICGTVLEGKSISLVPNADYFGVRLSVKSSMMLPGLPLKEAIGLQVPFEEALRPYSRVGEKLAEADTFEDKIARFERDCLPLIVPDGGASGLVDYCLSAMHRSCGSVAIKALAEKCGYSERYVRTKFEQTVGMPPKLYNRIVRFQQALEGVVRGTRPLTEVANDRGYFDQAHFMKDFMTFSRLSPSQIRSLCSLRGRTLL
ncbi:helix-turn-helix domain-containing protein [Cohnella sp.]|uniref:helix-turn-helix domain-containing protein n=1 Tax=Cohnella sp. TaxID=1883426 RepID=UPI00356401FE